MYQIIILPHFRSQLKRHIKKHKDLKESLIMTLKSFHKENHPHLGNDLYKIRFCSNDLPRGKNRFFRLIVLLMESEKFLVPVAIFFKDDRDNLPRKKVNFHLESALLELRKKN